LGVSDVTLNQHYTSFTEVFDELFPMFLSIGMSAKEYWWGDNELPKAYLKAKELKDRQQNTWLWWQGAYFYEALCDVAPLLNPFNKHPKALEYPSEPYPMSAKEKEEQELRKQKANYEKMIAFMKARSDNGRS